MPQVVGAVVAGFTTFGTAAAAGAGALAAGLGVTAAFNIGAFFATVGGRLLLSVSLSALQAALQDKPELPKQGLRTPVTTRGEVNPASFLLGRWSTEGNQMCPNYSHGEDNRYHTIIIDLGDIPITSLQRIALDKEWSDLGSVAHSEYGFPILTRQTSDTQTRRVPTDPNWVDPEQTTWTTQTTVTTEDFAWVKFYDGTQAAVDPMLLDKYATHPERPWSADMVGIGIPYAIVTLDLNREVSPKIPDLRFEAYGIPLYDPRFDTTVGGAGSQRADDPATWANSNNPMVQIYNIARGIPLPNGRIYGGGFEAADLPLANWFAAMNECSQSVAAPGGGQEQQFISGYEVGVDMEPAAVMEEIGKGCSAKFVEDAGRLMTRCGPAALPVMYYERGDILEGFETSATPFPPLREAFNGARASYLEPDEVWEPKEAPGAYSEEMLAEDNGQENIADLNFTTVWSTGQAQRLLNFWLLDNRRFRRQTLALGAAFMALQPLDVVGEVVDGDQAGAKLYEVGQVTRSTEALAVALSAREVDPSDAVVVPEQLVPVVPGSPTIVQTPPIQLTNVQVQGGAIIDGQSNERRPQITIAYNQNPLIRGLRYIVYPAGRSVPNPPGVSHEPGFAAISEGILPGETYDLVLYPIASGQTLPTIISGIQVPDIRIGSDDLEVDFVNRVATAETDAQNAYDDVQQIITDVEDLEDDVGVFASAHVGLTVDLNNDGDVVGIRATDYQNPNGQGGSLLELLGQVVKAGTLTFDRLVSGASGKNEIYNSRFYSGLRGFAKLNGSGAVDANTTLILRPAGTSFAGKTYPTIALFQNSTDTDGLSNISMMGLNPDGTETARGFPVEPGKWYGAGVRASSHRCAGVLFIFWRDADGLFISATANAATPLSEIPDNVVSSSDNPEEWPHYWTHGQAPVGAKFGQVIPRKFGTTIGNDSYLFIHKPHTFRSHASATEPAEYSPEGVTLVDGGSLLANSVTAAKMDVTDLSAITAQIGVVQSLNYAEDGNGLPLSGFRHDGPNDVIKGVDFINGKGLIDQTVSITKNQSGTTYVSEAADSSVAIQMTGLSFEEKKLVGVELINPVEIWLSVTCNKTSTIGNVSPGPNDYAMVEIRILDSSGATMEVFTKESLGAIEAPAQDGAEAKPRGQATLFRTLDDFQLNYADIDEVRVTVFCRDKIGGGSNQINATCRLKVHQINK